MTYNFNLDVPETMLAGSNEGRSRVLKMPAFEGNLGGYGRDNEPRALVLHTPEEDADDIEVTPRWFRDPRARASTHYYADNDGDLIQMVAEKDCAWAQGTRSGVNRHWNGARDARPPWGQIGVSNNCLALSIEVEGRAATIGTTITAAQFETVARWIAFEADRYAIPLDRDHVVRHSQLATDRTDPGTLSVNALIGRARRLLGLDAEDAVDPIPFEEGPDNSTSEDEMIRRFRLAYVRGFSMAKTRVMNAARVWLDVLDDDLVLRDEDVDDAVVDLLP